jgi:NAD(P)-dependent dehydrogenase (short-subunit alcohol dehydrogenase family)
MQPSHLRYPQSHLADALPRDRILSTSMLIICHSGIINTPMINSFGAVESGKLDVFARVPLARICEPEEVGHLFCFLLSDDSKYITGSTYRVDGGMCS